MDYSSREIIVFFISYLSSFGQLKVTWLTVPMQHHVWAPLLLHLHLRCRKVKRMKNRNPSFWLMPLQNCSDQKKIGHLLKTADGEASKDHLLRKACIQHLMCVSAPSLSRIWCTLICHPNQNFTKCGIKCMHLHSSLTFH